MIDVNPATKSKRGNSGKQYGPGVAIYLYCVTAGEQKVKGKRQKAKTPAVAGPAGIQNRGVDGVGAVEAVSCSEFLCWTSPVSREEFATRLNDNMQNLDWLAAASVRHQQVVAEIASRGDVLPARFATVFLTPDSLQQDVKRRSRELRRNLKRVRGCDERGVK